MSRSALPCACLALACFAGVLHAQESTLHRYELPGFHALELSLPPGWQDAVDEQPGTAAITIEIRPQDGAGFEIFLRPEPNGEPPGRIEDAATLRAGVRDEALRQTPGSVALPLELRRLQGTDGVGFYFIATDYSAAQEELPNLAQGALLVGGLVLRFEILSRSGQEAAVEQALALLQGAVHRDRGRGSP
jgi:hypothetical protein